MSYSRTQSGGTTVEVKNQKVFINGRLVTAEQMEQAKYGKIFGMTCLVVGWLMGAFSVAVILPLLTATS